LSPVSKGIIYCSTHSLPLPWIGTLRSSGTVKVPPNPLVGERQELARIKKGTVDHEGDFLKMASEDFTPYYKPLIPLVKKLRRLVFPNGERWGKDDPNLYSRMREVLRKAMDDHDVKAGWTG
jgi:hypothetical protein